MNAAQVKVWDPFIRIFHWSLVVLFAIAYLSEGEPEWLHVYAGYAIGVLITTRLIWGVVGSRHARFSDFVRSPAAAFGYLKDLATGGARRYLGHNPAGGWMALLLMASLLMTGVSGLIVYGLEGDGPLAGRLGADSAAVTVVPPLAARAYDDDDDDEHEAGEGGYGGESETDDVWEEIHELFANLTVLLVLLHIGGVLASSIAHGENLARSMVTGYKRTD